MVCSKELEALIEAACHIGAKVKVTMDNGAMNAEGRSIISTVQVSGLRGCGPHPMPPVAAAECLRMALPVAFENKLVNEIVRRNALSAKSDGLFQELIAETAFFESVAETERVTSGLALFRFDKERVIQRAENLWKSFWCDVTLVDASVSTTQRFATLLYKGEKIDVFDNSVPAGKADFSKKSIGDWACYERHSLEELKRVLITWLARNKPGLFVLN